MQDFTSLTELLMWIAGGGGAAILIGRAVSLWLENNTWWHNLSPLVKRFATGVLSLAFGLVAEAVLSIDLSGLLGQFAPLVGTLVLAIWNWLAGQQQYLSTKDTSYAASAKVPSIGP